MGFFDGVSNNVKLKLKQDQISKLSDAWYIEQSSINRDIRNRVLYCRIFRPDPPLYYVQYVALHFDRAKFGKYAILETAAYNIQTKKYSDYKKQRLEKSFSEDQTDAMGILYNLEAKRMGVSYLPLTEGEEHPFYQYVDSQKKQHELSYIINGDIIADAKRRIYNVFWVDRVKSFASVIHETHDYIRVQVQDEAFKFLDVEFATVEGGHRIRTSFYAGDDLPQDAFRKYFKAFSKDIQESVRLEKAGKERTVRLYVPKRLTEQQSLLLQIFNEKEVLELDSVKEDIVKNFLYLTDMWKKKHLRQSLCMAFCGNVGCGKLLVARKTAQLFRQAGLLSSEKIEERSFDSFFVSQYVGTANQELSNAYNKVRGGVLILTGLEKLVAHSASNWDGTQEVIGRLTEEVQSDASGTIVIVTSTRDGIENANRVADFSSLFRLIEFDDLSLDALEKLTVKDIHQKGYDVAKSCLPKISEYLRFQLKLGGAYAGNGDLAEGLANECVMKNIERLFSGGAQGNEQDTDMVILPEDVPEITKPDPRFDLEKKFEEAGILGLEEVKEEFRKIRKSILAGKALGDNPYLGGRWKGQATSYHMAFLGNPGTGKTTFARVMGEILFNSGVTMKKNVTTVYGRDLLKSSDALQAAFHDAIGGVLFIDEAYAISQSVTGYGREVVNELVPLMEDNRDLIVVIFAGYTAEMNELLDLNPGLASRIPFRITFPDYSVDELVEIGEQKEELAGTFQFTEDADRAFHERIKEAKTQNPKYFGNVRTVRNILDQVKTNQGIRLFEMYGQEDFEKLKSLPPEIALQITEDDFLNVKVEDSRGE